MVIDEKNRYYSLDRYYRETFGSKIYKISLDGGFTCPNRDGRCGTGGCIFCDGGSGYFSSSLKVSLDQQINDAKARVCSKYHADKFIAYFQSYTGTYASLDVLRNIYDPVIKREDIAGLSVGTRPDCLSDDIISYFAQLNKEKPVFIELGLQSTNTYTVDLINRCYGNDVYFSAAEKLRGSGINVVTHVIFGFPWETPDDMLKTIKDISMVTDGIKIHMLYILQNTEIHHMFNKNNYRLLNLEEYTNVLCRAIELLPENVVIHRITGDPPKKSLVAPLWTTDKKRNLNYIKKCFEINNIIQGRHFKKDEKI